MGRSVSTHRHAVATAYIRLDDDFDPDFGWPDFLEDLRENVLKPAYPSLCNSDRWQDREDHVIAENRQVEVSVSEYCGLVAVCLAPLDPDNAFHCAVAQRLARAFQARINKAFPQSALQSVGHASNGEQFFRQVG